VVLIRPPENVGENHDISFKASSSLRLAGHLSCYSQAYVGLIRLIIAT